MKEEPQIFTRIDREDVPVNNDVLDALRQGGMSESIIRGYIRELINESSSAGGLPQPDKSQSVVTFDFDDTLLNTRPDEDWGLVEDGPNIQMINHLHKLKSAGHTVYVISTRIKKHEDISHYEPDHPAYRQDIQAFIDEHALPVDGIFFTNGNYKAATLMKLGSVLHFDDDEEEIKMIQFKAPDIQTHWIQV